MNTRNVFLSLAFTSLVIGGAACSSSGGTGVATPTPTPSGSSALSLGTQGNISCTAPNNAVPGTYISLFTQGSVVGNTYVQSEGNPEYGIYVTAAYTAGASPAPSPTPIAIPSVPPGTPGATLWIVYYGEYTLPTTPGITTAPTNGCFVVETASTTPGQGTPTGFNVDGYGTPQFAAPYPSQSANIIEGAITAFTINNVTRTSGNGTFTINTAISGESQTATGTSVITGSTAFYANETLNSGSILRRP